MRRRHILMGLGLAGSCWLVVFGDQSPDSVIAEASSKAPGSPGSSAVPRTVVQRAGGLSYLGKELFAAELQPREVLLGRASHAKHEDGLFASRTWAPPPPPPPKLSPAAPPPVPFTYLGKKTEEGIWEVYLAQGEQTYIAREQTVIASSYRIDAIRPPVLSLTYLPLALAQSINIGGMD